ncbi:hemagglutinin-related protein [Escherichia coli]|nr:hemagglutinin-related protein [Escherichia coli]
MGNHTQLNGAVIASTATDDKNSLSTGTLGWSDIHNQADYKASHTGISLSGGSGMSASQMVASNAIAGAANALTGMSGSSGHAEGTTSSAISGGNLIIRDQESQKQDIAGLSRDPENANGSIAPIFDREKEQKRLQEAQVISQVSGQMSNIVMTYGETEAMKAARKEHPGMSDAQLRETPEYREVMKGYGTGSTPQMVVQAITGVLGGLNAGNPGQVLAGGLNPAVAQLIKQATGDNREANLMAHAVWGALAAQLGGNNAASGAAGAFSGELAARYIIDNYYGGRTDNLSEQERQQISMLATIASGIAGGLAGNSTSAAGTGAQAGRNSVENNFLSSKEARQFDEELVECKASGGDCKSVIQKYLDISNKNSKELAEACTGGGVACVTWEELIQGSTNVANDPHSGQFRLDEKLKDPDAAAIVNYLNGSDLKFLKDNITEGDRLLSVISDPTSWPVAVMGGKAFITNAVNNTKEQLIAVGVGVGLGAGIQYGTTGEVKLSDLIGTGLIGGITAGKGYNPTVTWNAVGGYYQAEISGDDPFIASLLSKVGASAGYAAGNVLKVPFDKKLNPISKQYEWIPTGVWTITKPAPQHPLPSIMGNVGDSAVSGMVQDKLKDSGGK